MTEETEFDPEVAELKQAYEELFKEIGGVQCEFEQGVKSITKKKRPERALDWFCRFIRSRAETEELASKEIANYRINGFGIMRVDILRRDFGVEAPEKSSSAKQSAKKRRKRRQRGRVKSKNDKALGGQGKSRKRFDRVWNFKAPFVGREMSSVAEAEVIR
jgi:hypothetical protein